MAEPKITFSQRALWKLREQFYRVPFSKKDFEALNALKCRIAYNAYGGYCVPLSSRRRPAAAKVLSGQVHEPKTIEYIAAHCTGGDIVHAGTYFGDFLPAFSKASAPGATVWAFEPNEENYRCAQLTCAVNFIENVELRHAGLGERKGSSSVLVSDGKGQAMGGASRILMEEETGVAGGKMAVDIVAIDDVVPRDRRVSIIQLDVEGHEQQALSGSLDTIRRCLPIIMVEVLRGSPLLESAWFSENILSLGYQMRDFIHKNSVFVPA